MAGLQRKLVDWLEDVAQDRGVSARQVFHDWLKGLDWNLSAAERYLKDHGVRGTRAALRRRMEAWGVNRNEAVVLDPDGVIYVGRERELAALRRGLRRGFKAGGRALLLAGEPGIGKSYTAEKIGREASQQGVEVLFGRCVEESGAPPFWPWVQVLREFLSKRDASLFLDVLRDRHAIAMLMQILPELRSELPESMLDLGTFDSSEMEPDRARFFLFDAITCLLIGMARDRKLLIVLEDLHVADPDSIKLLAFLVREMDSFPGVLLGTYRDTEVRRGHPIREIVAELACEQTGEVILLEQFSLEEVAEFMEGELRETPSAELVDTVYAKGEGNPLFTHEMIRLLQASDDGDASVLEAPMSVHNAIRNRLSHLPADCFELLSKASVAGRRFSVDTLALITKHPAEKVLELLDYASEAGLVLSRKGGGRYHFSHALIRDVLYEDLPAADRMRLHEQVGSALLKRGDSVPSETAQHLLSALPVGRYELAVEACLKAGEAAREASAFDESLKHLEKAASVAERYGEDDSLTCGMLIELKGACSRAGHFERARAVSVQALKLAKQLREPELAARAAMTDECWAWTEQFEQAWAWAGKYAQEDPVYRQLLEGALSIAGEADSPSRAILMAQLASQTSYAQGEELDRLTEDALAIARRCGDSTALYWCLIARWSLLALPQYNAERRALADELLEIVCSEFEPSPDRVFYARHLRVAGLIEAGMVEEVDQELRELERLEGRVSHAWPQQARCAVALMRGEFDEARALMQLADLYHSRRASERRDFQFWVLCYLEGTLAQVENITERVSKERAGSPGWDLVYDVMMSILYDQTDRLEEARVILRSVSKNKFSRVQDDRVSRMTTLCVFAEVVATTNEPEAARDLYELILPHERYMVTTQFTVVAMGPVARFLGMLAAAFGDYDAAGRHYEVALERCEHFGARPFLALSQHEYAAMLLKRRKSGDIAKAEALSRQSYATASELGMGRLLKNLEILENAF